MRKQETVIVPADWGERDAGKMFEITEKPAVEAEKWGWRMFLTLKGVDGYIPDDVARLGMVGVAIRGLNTFLAAPVRFEDLEPLLDDLLTCVKRVRDERHPDVATPMMSDDIEEVRTVGWLRSEVLRVHTGFSFADALSTLTSTIQASAGSPST